MKLIDWVAEHFTEGVFMTIVWVVGIILLWLVILA
jgi:hypothetical protein